MAKKTQSQVLAEFREVHGDKYDYSKVIYTKMANKVTVICPEHGEWEIRPFAHFNQKQGCRFCRGYNGHNKNTNDSIIEKCRQTHGDKYDYSKMEFKSILKKVEIICPEHGSFWQTPDNHYRHGTGCPSCSKGAVGASKESVKAFDPIIKLLKEKNIEYFFDNTEFTIQIGQTTGRYSMDLYIPSLHMNIEYQGNAWHPDYNKLSDDEWNNWNIARGTCYADNKMRKDIEKCKFLFDTIGCTTWLVTPSLVDRYISFMLDIIKKAP